MEIRFKNLDEAPLVTLNQFVRNHLSKRECGPSIIVLSVSSDDGFSVINYNAVHPELGSWDDISELGESVGLMADLVLNHCSAKSDRLKFSRGSRSRKYFIEPDPSFVHGGGGPRSSDLLQTFEDGRSQKRKVYVRLVRTGGFKLCQS